MQSAVIEIITVILCDGMQSKATHPEDACTGIQVFRLIAPKVRLVVDEIPKAQHDVNLKTHGASCSIEVLDVGNHSTSSYSQAAEHDNRIFELQSPPVLFLTEPSSWPLLHVTGNQNIQPERRSRTPAKLLQPLTPSHPHHRT